MISTLTRKKNVLFLNMRYNTTIQDADEDTGIQNM